MQALASPVSPHLAEAVGWVLIHSIWQIAVVALLVGVALRALRRGAPDVRYLVAIGGLVVATGWPIYGFMKSLSAPKPLVTHVRPAKIVRSDVGPAFAMVETQASSTPPLQRALDSALPWLFLLWTLGVLIRGGMLIAGAVSVFRVHRDASPLKGEWLRIVARLRQKLGIWQPVFLVESIRAEVPFVVGWLRPTIVLPTSALTGMTPAQLENIIAHELGHVRRHDYLVNLLQVGLETLFFYHPGVWWLSEQIRAEREHCCDDLAASACAGPIAYARALAQLEVLRAVPTPALSATGGSLLERIRRLTGRTVARSERGVSGVTGMLLALAVALPIAAIVSISNGQTTPESSQTERSQLAALIAPAKLDLTADQVLRLGRLGLDANDIDAFRKVGLTKFDVLRSFATHGIDAHDFVAFKKAGHGKADTVLALARHGVDPGDIADFERVGLRSLDAKHLLDLARHGVDASDAVQLKVFLSQGDDPRQKVRKLVRLARFGVDGDDLAEFVKLNLPGFEVDDIMKLKRHGVDAEDVHAFRRAGVKMIDVDQLVKLARNGLDAEDLLELRAAGFERLSLDDAVHLSRHGVDGGDLRAFKAAGLSALTVDQVVDLARHGIDGGDYQAYRDAGLPELTIKDAIQLARHGIDADEVAQARAQGRASTVQELVRLARRGWR